jgi:hypothetical protein
MTAYELEPEEARRRRFHDPVDALTQGEVLEEDLSQDDWSLLADLYGEREDDLADMLEQIRRLGAEER